MQRSIHIIFKDVPNINFKDIKGDIMVVDYAFKIAPRYNHIVSFDKDFAEKYKIPNLHTLAEYNIENSIGHETETQNSLWFALEVAKKLGYKKTIIYNKDY